MVKVGLRNSVFRLQQETYQLWVSLKWVYIHFTPLLFTLLSVICLHGSNSCSRIKYLLSDQIPALGSNSLLFQTRHLKYQIVNTLCMIYITSRNTFFSVHISNPKSIFYRWFFMDHTNIPGELILQAPGCPRKRYRNALLHFSVFCMRFVHIMIDEKRNRMPLDLLEISFQDCVPFLQFNQVHLKSDVLC